MRPSASNKESFNTLGRVIKNAQKGFYIYTASHPMQRRVAEYYNAPDVAIYDYSRQNSAPYSFAVLAKWAIQQDARVFFVVNMQVALQKDEDIISLNFSRDLLSKMDRIWIFGMTPDADTRFCKIAYDFYSFIRMQVHFEDEAIEEKSPAVMIEDMPSGKYYTSHDEAEAQMQRYADLCDELFALPLDSNPDRLLAAAITLSNVAGLYYNYGYYDNAMKLFMRVKAIREKLLDKEHPDTAIAYNDIGLVYRRQGEYSKALEWGEAYKIHLTPDCK